MENNENNNDNKKSLAEKLIDKLPAWMRWTICMTLIIAVSILPIILEFFS